eukprot:COSAG01_NODE_286_length_19421_cov_123.895663_23_plen_118_part_00
MLVNVGQSQPAKIAVALISHLAILAWLSFGTRRSHAALPLADRRGTSHLSGARLRPPCGPCKPRKLANNLPPNPPPPAALKPAHSPVSKSRQIPTVALGPQPAAGSRSGIVWALHRL